MPLQGAQTLEARAHHRHTEMRLAAWWDRVASTLVTQLQHLGVQSLLQLHANGGLNRTAGPRSRAAPGQTDAAGHGEQAPDQLSTRHRLLRLSLGYRSSRSGTRFLTFSAKCCPGVLRHAGKWSPFYATVDWTGVRGALRAHGNCSLRVSRFVRSLSEAEKCNKPENHADTQTKTENPCAVGIGIIRYSLLPIKSCRSSSPAPSFYIQENGSLFHVLNIIVVRQARPAG